MGRKVVRVWIMKIWSASRQVRQQPRMRPLQRSSPAPPDQPPADLLCGWEQLLFSNKCGSGGPRRAKTSRAWTRIAQNEAQARREAANEPALASTPPYAWRCGKYSSSPLPRTLLCGSAVELSALRMKSPSDMVKMALLYPLPVLLDLS